MNPDFMLSENKQHIGKSVSNSKTGMSCNFLKQKCASPCPLRGREPALTIYPSSENFP